MTKTRPRWPKPRSDRHNFAVVCFWLFLYAAALIALVAATS